MCVEHGCLKGVLPKQLLDDANVSSAFEQMRSKTVPQNMRRYPLREMTRCGPHHFLQVRWQMVPPDLLAGAIQATLRRRENILPMLLFRSRWVPHRQSIWNIHADPMIFAVFKMPCLLSIEIRCEFGN